MANMIINRRLNRESRRNGSQEPGRLRVKDPDHFQVLFSRLQSLGFGIGGAVRTVGFTSCVQKEGTTTVASHIAVQAAECADAKVLIVDANLVQPAMHKTFDVSFTPGLMDFATDDVDVDEIIQASTVPNLSILAAGTNDGVYGFNLPIDAAIRFDKLISERFDLVVVDLSAVRASSNVWALSAALDGVVLVLAEDGVSQELAERSLKQLKESGTNLLGVAFNKRRNHIPKWIGGY